MGGKIRLNSAGLGLAVNGLHSTAMDLHRRELNISAGPPCQNEYQLSYLARNWPQPA